MIPIGKILAFFSNLGLPGSKLEQIKAQVELRNNELLSNIKNNSLINVNLNFYPPTTNSDLIDVFPEAFKEHKGGYVRIEESEKRAITQYETLLSGDSLKYLKSILLTDDFHAVILARTTIKYDELEDQQKAMEVYNELVRKHGERGRRIFNLIRGGYLKDFFFDLDMKGFTGADPFALQDKYREKFKKLINFCENAIFINNKSEDFAILREVNAKLKDYGVVNIHFREWNEEKIEVCEYKISHDHPDIIITSQHDGDLFGKPVFIKKFSLPGVELNSGESPEITRIKKKKKIRKRKGPKRRK